MVTLSPLKKYDAIFFRSPCSDYSYEFSSNSDWGFALALLLADEVLRNKADIEEWLNNNSEKEFYGISIQLVKENNTLKACPSFFDMELEEYSAFEIAEIGGVIARWRELLDERPPAIILQKINGKITLIPEYDVNLIERKQER